MNRYHTWLVVLLRVDAAVLLLALGAVVMPTGWMAAVHAWLGLGPFPEAVLTEYLTRSLSLFYASHGTLVLLLSFDVVRNRPLVTWLGWMNVVFGAAMLGLDLAVGLPWHWTAVEGPAVAANGAAILWLNSRSTRR